MQLNLTDKELIERYRECERLIKRDGVAKSKSNGGLFVRRQLKAAIRSRGALSAVRSALRC